MKRIELVRILNKEMKKYKSRVYFVVDDYLCVINVKIKDMFLERSILSLTQQFYDIVDSKIKEVTKVKGVGWNNTAHSFSLWVNQNTNFFEDFKLPDMLRRTK